MRVNFSFVAAILVAPLLMSCTVGCRSNGGDWYNPKTYSWTNPFANDSSTSPRSPGTTAGAKPRLDSSPNISTPDGGYSSNVADRSASRSGTPGGFPSEQWGQQNQTASRTPPTHLGDYSEPVPSNYPPNYLMDGNTMGVQQSQYPQQQYVTHVPQQQYVAHAPQQGQFPQEMGQQQNMQYGYSDYVQTDYRQPVNTGYQQPIQQAPGTLVYQGNYAPFEAIQQPVTVPPMGNGFEQPMQTSQQSMPVNANMFPQQQPLPTNGYNNQW